MAETWQDHGVLLTSRPLNEGDVIATFLTHQRGRHAGVIKGGNGRRNRGLYQIGNAFDLTWRARLSEHLGSYICEPGTPWGSAILADRTGLARLSALCAVLDACLPEREVFPELYVQTSTLLADLTHRDWDASYAVFEIRLLETLGFGLDLTECAATGATSDLTHVSPKSGRAVSQGAAQPYLDRLLPLPSFLRDGWVNVKPDDTQVALALALTGHFLDAHFFAPYRRELPVARQRLLSRLSR